MSPFDEGVSAVTTGMSGDGNPYELGTTAHSDWEAGYSSGVDADEATEFDDDPNRKGIHSDR